mgnify:CR=1 FL=1
MSDWIVITEYLARTADGRLVPETHPDARFLAYIPGARIPWDEAERLGLVTIEVKEYGPVEDKMLEKPEDKGVKYPSEARRARRRR